MQRTEMCLYFKSSSILQGREPQYFENRNLGATLATVTKYSDDVILLSMLMSYILLIVNKMFSLNPTFFIIRQR